MSRNKNKKPELLRDRKRSVLNRLLMKQLRYIDYKQDRGKKKN